jgi:CubicO group peptidase (beta-lactamase class C family)/D-alanyl-D-alanine dipeptidase
MRRTMADMVRRRIKTSVFFLAWLAVVVGSVSGQPVVEAREPYGDAVRVLERWVAAEVEAKGLPGLSIALVDDQRVVWARGFGFADPARRRPATADTVYRVGSVSKLFTDLAAMQLVEQGKLDLDAPLERALPGFAPRNPFGTPITLRQLMCHRSGLVREPPVGHYFDPTPSALNEVVGSLNGTSLVYEPGTHTKYSNAAVTVVGAVVERLRGEPFAGSVRRTVLDPLGLSRTSFEPGPALTNDLAHAAMWTYDGQPLATPTFLLGTGPAGNLVSTVNDLGRFLSALFAGGRGPDGPVVEAETLRSMLTPQLGKPKETPAFGLGFALSTLEGQRRIGHGGAVYGFATELAALPDAKLGAVVIASRDCANGTVKQIADTALLQMLASRNGEPLPLLPDATKPVPTDQARRVTGRYAKDDRAVEIFERQGKLFLAPFGSGQTVEIRAWEDFLLIDDRLTLGTTLKVNGDRLFLGRERLERRPVDKPGPVPDHWLGLIGEYGWDHNVLYIFEKDGQLHALIEWFFEYPLKEVGPDRYDFPRSGLYDGESLVFHRDTTGRANRVEAAGVNFARRNLDGENGQTFRVTPARPVAALRDEIRSARPPVEKAEFRKPDLVDLAALDPTIKLDVRYATANNFLGTPLYTSARAFLQRPAAEALLRTHRSLGERGFGLLIHDAYRPWQVTKLFWEATPEASRMFVADPLKGSKHNRGAAVDLTLYDSATGRPVVMVGGYDEFSPRSNPDYPGGTSLQRWHRDLLRRAMEAQGFTVNEVEWWHFDHRDWGRYPIINRRFEELDAAEGGR